MPHLADQSSETLQYKIVRQMRAKILAGELAAGQPLPSVRALAREQKVSVITVQRAYKTLLSEELIQSQQGKGVFVAKLSSPQKLAMAQERFSQQLTPIVEEALAQGLSRTLVRRSLMRLLDRRGNKR